MRSTKRTEFENKYFSITSTLESIIEDKVVATRTAKTITNGYNLQEMREEMSIIQISSASSDYLKLSRVNLPVFSGAIEE